MYIYVRGKVGELAGGVHYFVKFKQRVYVLLAQATRVGQPVTVRQAELMEWQEVEEESLHLNPRSMSHP